MSLQEGTDDVLDQADALMQRYRCFVARPVEEAPLPTCPDPTPDLDDDLPVLTDIVDTPPIHAPDRAVCQAKIERALEDWLDQTVPLLLAHAADALRDEIAARARAELLPQLTETLNHGTRQEL